MKTRLKLSGKKAKIRDDATHPQVKDFGGSEIHIEGYWDDITGGSWMFADGNPACLAYALRKGLCGYQIPSDNEVLYGKIGSYGHLVHVSELEID